MKKLLFILSLFASLVSCGQRQVLGIDKNNALASEPKLFIMTGNSIGNGHPDCNTPASCNIGDQVYNALNTNSQYTYFNTSVNGRGLSTMISVLPTEVYPKFVGAYTKIIVGAVEGTNSMLNASGTGADVAELMFDYAEELLQENHKVRVLLYMCINGDTNSTHPFFLVESERIIYNDLLAEAPASARFAAYPNRVKVVDIRDIPELNDADAHLNATYYTDGIHLTAAGYLLLGARGVTVAQTF